MHIEEFIFRLWPRMCVCYSSFCWETYRYKNNKARFSLALFYLLTEFVNAFVHTKVFC